MKSFLRKCVELFLRFLVRIKLARIHPTIIGVTGSFGKTSTKEAIYLVMKTKWRVKRSEKSLNTEIGLLLAVLEQKSGFSSPFKWLASLYGALKNGLTSQSFDFLILEYGADKPGDISHLVAAVKPDIGVITHIAATHQAKGQFSSAEAVFQEKQKLVTHMGSSGVALLNAADPFLKKLGAQLKVKVFLWHAHEGIFSSVLSARHTHNTKSGFETTIIHGKDEVHADFPIAGSFHIDVVLPALLVGLLHGISLKEGINALQNFCLPPGRMGIIEGKGGATLLDSTYNASPETVKEALGLLHDLPGRHKIAVLGSMNELGDYGIRAHKEVASALGPWISLLITVGELSKETAREALKHGVSEHSIKSFLHAEEAATFLLERGLSEDDVILLKGSQNHVRLERAVKMLMARPKEAEQLLCRQEKEWLSK